MRVADLLSCEVLNLLANNRDASFVTCVQFKDARLVELRSVKLEKSARNLGGKQFGRTSFAKARMVLVFPVPGGPYNLRFR